jgi:hypothetical protein
MWMACTNRDTIKLAASLGLGALSFSFVDPDEAHTWSQAYYDIIKSDQCVPLGHTVNANIAMVSAFSLHEDRAEAVRRGQEGFEFFAYALRSLVVQDNVPGRSHIWDDFQSQRGDKGERILAAVDGGADHEHAPGIGTPADFLEHARLFQEGGVDQIILLQQAGRNTHQQICESLELFAATVLPALTKDRQQREKAKADELAPYIAAALARKKRMPDLTDDEIPVVRAAVDRVRINESNAAGTTR